MSHIHTIVKVKTDTPELAVEEVNNLLTDNGEYKAYDTSLSAFDYCSEDETKVLEDFTEEKFLELRQQELNEVKELKRRSAHERDLSMKGYYLEQAGKLLGDSFWCYDRLAFDHSVNQDDPGRNTYYVETDRHY